MYSAFEVLSMKPPGFAGGWLLSVTIEKVEYGYAV